MPQRKLASVLPEPVGAQISALSPPEIASHPPAWAGVGAAKEASNQRLTGALKGASGSDPVLAFASVLNPPILRGGCYGVPPANFTYSYQDFFGWKPLAKSPEPLQKLQTPA